MLSINVGITESKYEEIGWSAAMSEFVGGKTEGCQVLRRFRLLTGAISNISTSVQNFLLRPITVYKVVVLLLYSSKSRTKLVCTTGDAMRRIQTAASW